MPEIVLERLLVLTIVSAIFLFLAAGYVDTSDADASIETARSLIERASLRASPKSVDYQYYARTSPCCYSKMGWLHPILYAPALGLVKAIGVSEHWRSRAEGFLISLVNPGLTALTIFLLFLFFRRQHDLLRSIQFCAIAAFSTLLLPYSKTTHREPAQALLLTLAYYLATHASAAKLSIQVGFGLVVAVALATKIALIVPFLPAVFLILLRSIRSRPALLRTLGIVIGAGSIVIAVSYYTFGNWGGGYGAWIIRWDPRVWSTPFWKGMFQQLLSIDSGLVVHQPWILLLPFVLIQKRRVGNFSAVDIALCVTCLLQIALYAKWYSPIGNEAIGPRYLVAVVPVMVLFFNGLELRRWPLVMRYAGILLFLVSTAISVVNSSVKIQQYWTMQATVRERLPAPHWLINIRLFAHKLGNDTEVYRRSDLGLSGEGAIDVSHVPSLRGFNFWWSHLLRARQDFALLSDT